MSALTRAVLVAVVAAVLVGCGGGSAGGNDLATSEPVERFFDAYASREPDRFDEMLAASEPGSPAHVFALHEIAIRMAFTADGLEVPEPAPREVVDGDIVVDFGPETARTYSDFEVDETGLLTSFSERPTSSSGAPTPISERRVAGDGTETAAFDASFELLTVFAGAAELIVTLEVRSGAESLRLNAETAPLVELPLPRPVEPGGAVTSYVDRTGVEHVVTTVFGHTDVPAATTTVLMLGFEGAAPGGTIFVPVGRAGELETVAISVPRL